MILQNTLINVKQKIKRVDEILRDREVTEVTDYFISKKGKDSVRYHEERLGFYTAKGKSY